MRTSRALDAGVKILGASPDSVAAQKAFAEKYGFPPESFLMALCISISPGLSAAQVTRELIIRGGHPRCKAALPLAGAAPNSDVMAR